MRASLLLGILAAGVVASGCFGEPTVRVALLTERLEFDERAPAEAAEALVLIGCVGVYDAAAGRIVLEPSPSGEAMFPDFVLVWQRAEDSTGPMGAPDPSAGTSWPMSARSGGGGFDSATFHQWMIERGGSSGSWGHGIPYHSDSELVVRWDKDGASLDGELLRQDEVVTRMLEHEVSQYNVTFSVRQEVTATYLGRLPYDVRAECP